MNGQKRKFLKFLSCATVSAAWRFAVFIVICAVPGFVLQGAAQNAAPPPPSSSAAAAAPANDTEIVFLGTGMPNPNPDRQGPSLAVVVHGRAYLVDAGTGVVRQANAAFQRGIKALKPGALDIAFLTHLHSDHTIGLPDLIFTPWVSGRETPLKLYGPTGTKEMAGHLLEAYQQDIQIRREGLEHGNATGYKVEAHDSKPGEVYRDSNVTVRAFQVPHGSWKESFGYRFDVGSTSIVISGDTASSDAVVQACNGCSVLIHEVYTGAGAAKPGVSMEEWMAYMKAFHTSAAELGDIAARAKAKMLVVTHWVPMGDPSQDDLIRAIHEKYSGPVMIARDLDVVAP